MSDTNQVLTRANVGTSTGLEFNNGTKKIDVNAAEIDVTAATNTTATTLLAALSEIGGRLAALEA